MTTTVQHPKPNLHVDEVPTHHVDESWDAAWATVTTWLADQTDDGSGADIDEYASEQRLAQWIQARVREIPLTNIDSSPLGMAFESILSIQQSRGLIIVAPSIHRVHAAVESCLSEDVVTHPLYAPFSLDHTSPPHAFADECYRISPKSYEGYVLPYTLWVDAEQWPRLLHKLQGKPMRNPPLVVLCQPQWWLGSASVIRALAQTLQTFDDRVVWLGPNPFDKQSHAATTRWQKYHCLTVAHKWIQLTRLLRQETVHAIMTDSPYERDELTDRLSRFATKHSLPVLPQVACWADVATLMPLIRDAETPHIVSWSTPSTVLPWVLDCVDHLKNTRVSLLSCRDDHRHRLQQRQLGGSSFIPQQKGYSPSSHLQSTLLESYAQWLGRSCACPPNSATFMTALGRAKSSVWTRFWPFKMRTYNCDQCHSISSAWRNLRHWVLF